MEIKASDVKALREKTGAGMMECKKALTEANGDFAQAEKILKELGLAAAKKRSDRATNEGRVFTQVSQSKAAALEISCETDFVAMNDDFVTLGNELVQEIVDKDIQSVTDDMETRVKELAGVLKENLSLRRFKVLSINDKELVVDYVHGAGRIGVLIKLSVENEDQLNNDQVKEFAFDMALHVAAFNPRYLDRSQVEESYLKEQEEIFTTQAKSLGKPEKVLEGIVKGKLNKHLSEICLVNQGFVKDEKQSVEKVMQALSKETGGKIEIADYVYFGVGGEI